MFAHDHFAKKKILSEAVRGLRGTSGASMPELPEAHEIVSRDGWLSRTPPTFQRIVLDRSQLQTFETGAPVYALGDPPGGMYGLVSGGLGITIAPNEIGPYFAHFARPGTWFGEAAALTGQPRRIGLMATRETQLLHLPLHAILDIVAKDPSAWRMFALVTIGHLDVAIGACDDLMIRDHRKRFLAVLLRLAGSRLTTPHGATPIDVDVSQEDLAVLANIARTTAGALLRQLEADGHVELSYRRIRISDPSALREMLRR
jgi:CRP/FNR family transcriptional regulator, cyclic AMP receptor protein